jgi:hypothetical protein
MIRFRARFAGRSTPLTIAAISLAAAQIAHALDHVFQERGLGGLEPQILWGGVALLVAAYGTLVLVLLGHPAAPRVALAVGLFAAIGVTAAHVPPDWGWACDSYPDRSSTGASWIAMLSEPIAGAVLAAVALQTLLKQRRSRSTALTGATPVPR